MGGDIAPSYPPKVSLDYDVEYTSGGINPVQENLDWGRNDLVCYGVKQHIYIYNPLKKKVIDSFTSRHGDVQSVKWTKKVDGTSEDELIYMTRKFLCVWDFQNRRLKQILNFPVLNLLCFTTCNRNLGSENSFIFCGSVGPNGTRPKVHVLKRDSYDETFESSQIIPFPLHVTNCVSATVIETYHQVLLAVSLTDNNIVLFIEKEISGQFEYATKLDHPEWVMSMDITFEDRILKLAAACQDTSMRLWEMSTDIETRFILPSHMQHSFVCVEHMNGHDGCVILVRFHPINPKQLISASVDKTLIIWEYSEQQKYWMDIGRFGDVGGNFIGFYGAVFSPDGLSILAYNYQSSFYLWELNKDTNSWDAGVVPGGHKEKVSDICWEPQGELLLSTSFDKSTRIHGPWFHNNVVEGWFEMARPQMHGHPMTSITTCGRYRFISSGEEKVIRVFDAPANFVENIRRICNVTSDTEGDSIIDKNQSGTPQGAAMPALGLSNKAVYTNGSVNEGTSNGDENNASKFIPLTSSAPPLENQLMQNTLWPEIQKLYGHGLEVYCVASSPDGKFLASSCVSHTKEEAFIILWDLNNFQIIDRLYIHALTVVDLAFSPDSQHLLSTSRDRRWSLFKLTDGTYKIIASLPKEIRAHKRIIWTGCWSSDGKYFGTGSRDAKFIIWRINPDKPNVDAMGQCEEVHRIQLTCQEENSIQSATFAPMTFGKNYLFALGLQSGTILLYLWKGGSNCQEVLRIEDAFISIQKLKFRPFLGRVKCLGTENILELAACGDNQVKIFNIQIEKLHTM